MQLYSTSTISEDLTKISAVDGFSPLIGQYISLILALSLLFSVARFSFLCKTMSIVASWEKVFLNPSLPKCHLHSLGDYGDIKKERKKGTLLTFLIHLSYPFIPYLSLLSQLILLFLYAVHPSPPFSCFCVARLIEWTWNAPVTFSQRAPISAALQEQWRRLCRRRAGTFQTLLSRALIHHAQSPLVFFCHTALHLHPINPNQTTFNKVVVGYEV